jgi:hypothetical protein
VGAAAGGASKAWAPPQQRRRASAVEGHRRASGGGAGGKHQGMLLFERARRAALGLWRIGEVSSRIWRRRSSTHTTYLHSTAMPIFAAAASVEEEKRKKKMAAYGYEIASGLEMMSYIEAENDEERNSQVESK